MKITKARLENLIREEMKVIEEDDSLTPEEQTVARLMNELTTAIEDMGQSNVALGDYYFELFRAMSNAGVNTKFIADQT